MTECIDDSETSDIPSGNSVIRVRQVHGTRIVQAENVGTLDEVTEADGIVVTQAGLPIEIRVADCVPIVLYSPALGIGAVVHAGRKGLKGGIGRGAVAAMETAGAEARELCAAVGPSAGPCCYEVSEAMAAAWAEDGRPRRGRLLDLWAESERQLVASGIPPGRIEVAGICTICDTRFHSFRREGQSARNRVILVV